MFEACGDVSKYRKTQIGNDPETLKQMGRSFEETPTMNRIRTLKADNDRV